jgi:hypothetical protein
MAQVNNCKLVDPDSGLFNVLNLAQLRLAGRWWWESEDIDEEGCRGSIFRTWGDGEPTGLDKAYIIVADVTDDSTEPDISQITIHDVERIYPNIAIAVSKYVPARCDPSTVPDSFSFSVMRGRRWCLI